MFDDIGSRPLPIRLLGENAFAQDPIYEAAMSMLNGFDL